MHKRSYSTGQIATICGVNFQTVRRWIKQNQLKAYQLPGSRGDNRVRHDDLVDFLNEYCLPIPEELAPPNTRILIADDDPSITRVITMMLQHEGYDTAIANDGFNTGRLAVEFAPKLVLLDLQMPGLSGFDVIKQIRSSTILKALKIVVVSSMPEAQLKKALELGADDVVQKPFKNDELLDRIRPFFNKSDLIRKRELQGER